MQIRRLTEPDFDHFYALRLRALREHPAAFGSSYEESVAQPVEDFQTRLRENSTASNRFILGAFQEETLVGMIGFFQEPQRKRNHIGVIWGMYVVEEMHGQGVGRALLDETIRLASELSGVEQIILSVVTENKAAHRLYLSTGFEAYGLEPKALKVTGRYLDEAHMILHL